MLSRFMILATLLLSGCGSMKLSDVEHLGPPLVLEEYFIGDTEAWGVFIDRFGVLKRRFKVDIKGTFDGKELVLDEDFLYDDGEVQKRIWTIEVLGDGQYRGRADDVIGFAEGQAAGAGLTWAYDIDLKVGEQAWRVHFHDWLIMLDEETVYNRAIVSKWGFKIGEVQLFFKRDGKPLSDAAQDPA